MKSTIMNGIQRLIVAVIASFFTLAGFAQDGDKKVDVNISTDKGDNFWASPWVWVIGGAVFILLLVALLRGGGNKSDA